MEKDNQFYLTLVTIQAENCLFRIPRQLLETQSNVFRDMFSLPVATGEGEGSSDNNPIRLEGVKKKEFKRFLQVLLTGMCQESATSSDSVSDSVFDRWFPVIKLASMWEFDAIHKKAVQNMPYEQISKPLVEKVELAVRYDIQPWLLPAVNELARRKEPLGERDLEVLGPRLTLEVAAVRESLAAGGSYYYNHVPTLVCGTRNASAVDFTPAIKRVFHIQG